MSVYLAADNAAVDACCKGWPGRRYTARFWPGASGVHYIHPDSAAELFINEVGVAASHQRQGIGKAVMSALLDVGRARGCVGAWVITDESNAAARALYESMGASLGADSDGANRRPIGYSFDLEEEQK